MVLGNIVIHSWVCALLGVGLGMIMMYTFMKGE